MKIVCTPKMPGSHMKAAGQCRTCKRCLDCCGKESVYLSCAWRALRTPWKEQRRALAGYNGYWASVEAGRQKR